VPETAVRGSLNASEAEAIRRRIRTQQEWLKTIAVKTDGRAFVNIPDPKAAVEQILREVGIFYRLGFYPTPIRNDGKFHELEVRVNLPGHKVLARHGYVARDESPKASAARNELPSAMRSALNVSGLEISATATPVSVVNNAIRTALLIELRYPSPLKQSQRIDDELFVQVMVLDPDGRVLANANRTSALMTQAPGTAELVVALNSVIDLPNRPATLRLGVGSRALGLVGMVQLPFDRIPLQDPISIGGLAIEQPGATSAVALDRPLIQELLPFQPSTRRQFSARDRLRVATTVFWDSVESPTATLSLDDAAATEVMAATVTRPSGLGARQEGRFEATMPLTGLAAGQHVLRVSARTTQGRTVERVIPIFVRD
jgi:hypothetical protein